MHSPEIASWTHLDPAVKKLWRIEAGIAGAVYVVLFLGVGLILDAAIEGALVYFWPFGLAVGVALLLLSFYVAGKRFDFWRFTVGDDDLAVAHGIWWRTRIYVPRARIQHVDVTAGPISRALGLAVISVFVSGHAGAVATIPGLRADEAERLRKVLLKLSEQGPPPAAQEPIVG